MKKIILLTLMVPILFVLLSSAIKCAQERIVPHQKPIVPRPTNVSMINLIATPERYDGKMVSVVGFLAIESEDVRLYLSQDDYRHIISGNGIFIDANKEVTRDVEQKDLHYVQLVGVFKQKGLPTYLDPAITDIRLCLPWLELTDMRPRKLKDNSPETPR